ncbi:MAG: GlsB/YeaQ/YmgE family stress response membrane protein [Pirellulales bacterium]|nr:GlsB/YeaQ/YmgE family stress response membrane protein [Pirellulales bacterium]
MPELDLAPTAQQWLNVVLIWVGFGTVVGFLAKVILPLRQPAGSVPSLLLGLVGSLIGLLILSQFFGGRQFNPISPLGFLAAIAGAFLVLIGYRGLCGMLLVRKKRAGR